MKRVEFIVFSDLHINMWSKFNKDNSRTLNNFRVLHDIVGVCNEYDVPAIFCGDLFHKSTGIPIELLEILDDEIDWLYNHMRKDILAISGNHDINRVNTIESPKYSLVKYLSNRLPRFKCIDFTNLYIHLNFKIFGVPYIDHNIGLSDYLNRLELDDNANNILVLHTDYPGAKDTDGRIVDSVENLNLNILNKFDLVLCGHIHKPQRLSKKVYMIGAPLQQRRTDSKCKLGYWILYDDLSMEFKPLKYPKFIDVENSEDIKDDGNYYTVVPKTSRVKVNLKHKITKQLSKKSLAKKYMREKGIKDNKKRDLLINVLNKAEKLC